MLLRKKNKKTDALFFPPSHLEARTASCLICLHVCVFDVLASLPPRSLISALGFQVSPPRPPHLPLFCAFFFPSFIQYLGGSRFSAVRFRLGTLETRLGGVWTCCWFLTVNCDINSTFIYWRCNIKNVSRGGSCLFFFFSSLPPQLLLPPCKRL